MIKIIFLMLLSVLYLIANDTKPYWINDEKIPYRYYGKCGIFVHKNGKNYTINLAKNIAKQNLIKKLDKNINLTQDQKIDLMGHLKTKQYKSNNGRIYIFVYIDEYNL